MVRICHVAALLSAMTDAARLTSGVAEAYENFRRVHRNGAHEDDVSLADRRARFEASLKEVEAHNSQQPPATWKMTVNKFADYTHEERRAMLGYRRSARVASYAGPSSSFLEIEDDKQNRKIKRSLAKAFDWGQQDLASSRWVKDQGRCGSCWAHAAAGAIEMRLEAQTGNASLISVDQMIDCTPNPRKCGGTGGCKGATAELGFEYAKTKGLALQPGYSSTAGHDKCNDAGTASIVQVGGWIRLPPNEYEPLLAAVGKESPVAVSVDASKWFQYSSGVFGDCEKDAVVNHAVLLVGYGTDKASGQDYWRIRNSWGSKYGEDGHIRVLRHDSSDAYCGIDHEPEKGVACEGDPATMPVCGMCGILFDSSYPESVSIK